MTAFFDSDFHRMLLFALAFLCGILILQNFTALPDAQTLFVIIFVGLCISLVLIKYKKLFTICIGILSGFIYCVCYAWYLSFWILPSSLEGKDLLIDGYIESLPAKDEHRTTFLFAIKHLIIDHHIQQADGLVHLSWQNTKINLHVGDQWQLPVRLKKIHGTLNPGGFDYEAWAYQAHIRATGYIVEKYKPRLLNSSLSQFPIQRFREYLRDKIARALPQTNTSTWITALAIGERNNISDSQWQVLRNTGTNHLMAIAGLHIGMMSGLAFAIAAFLWRQFPRLLLYLPASHMGGLASLVMALIYSALAGFSIPTQRASIMLLTFLLVLLMRRHIAAWQAFSLALLCVLILNPLSVLTESVWLSFGSVALIIYGMHARLAPSGLWWKLGRIQWVIAVGLIPLSIWLFQQYSLVSFIANSIAIPCVALFIVPLTLLGCFCLLFSMTLGGWILSLADHLLAMLWVVLSYFSTLPFAHYYLAMPNLGYLVASCLGVVMLLVPSGFPGRWFGLIGLLPLFVYHPEGLKNGEMALTLLDVGQGLSAVIQTKQHVIVFDTGPKLSDHFDMGESVVLPYLHQQAIKKMDLLIISHGDNDHSGGALAVIDGMPVSQIKTSVPQQFKHNFVDYCLRNQAWEWDRVKFSFIYPTLDYLGLNNDSSCVLRIELGKHVIILPGDIEKLAEHFLVTQNKELLRADILVAPHHGSKTSGSDEFIDAVKPTMVLFPIGYRNRYHFPHPSVVAKYQALNTVMLDSIQAGAISLRLNDHDNFISEIKQYRILHRRYWNDR